MPDEFDPYYLWLGTPPEDQPFHAYKMLGLKLYESDPQIIATAADQRIAHVRTFRDGPRAVWSETLLGELTTIKLNLLNPEARAEYNGFGGISPPRRPKSPPSNRRLAIPFPPLKGWSRLQPLDHCSRRRMRLAVRDE